MTNSKKTSIQISIPADIPIAAIHDLARRHGYSLKADQDGTFHMEHFPQSFHPHDPERMARDRARKLYPPLKGVTLAIAKTPGEELKELMCKYIPTLIRRKK